MPGLSQAALQKAVEFIRSRARPLEATLYEYHFEKGTVDSVLDALAGFQNPDGGFGHGLEPDLRLPDSSVIATTVAFQIIRSLRVPADHPLVVQGCRYLRDTFDPGSGMWPIVPANVDDAPHAPWWVYGGDLSKSAANPRAEIAGYLLDYPEHFPASLRDRVVGEVSDYLLSHADEMEMHDLLCCIRFWETENLEESIRTRLLSKLRTIVDTVVVREPEQWKQYGLPPLGVVSSPASPFADLFSQAEINSNLELVVASQSENGAWTPNWSWGDKWQDVWAQAKQEWSGVNTLNSLRLLRAFGRLP